jgi:hypothetical protein
MPGHSAPLETEWSLLLAACSDIPAEERTARIRTRLGSQIRWDSLFRLAHHHGVHPLLAQALLRVQNELPPEALIDLKQSYQANLHKALFLSREFVRIVECLSRAGIEFLPYKGLTLAEAIYGDIALRQSGDIDLFIHADDLKRVREAVAELGYTPHVTLSEDEEKAYLKSGYECAFDAAAGRNLLEVQWAIQPRFYSVDLDMKGLFRRAQTVSVVGSKVKSPAPEDLFIVLALHAAKHVWGNLIWLCDLARISSLASLNWKRIGQQAQELGIVRILRVTLLLAQTLLGSPFPAAAAGYVAEDVAAESLAKEIENYFARGEAYDVESLAYFRLMLRLRERRVDRMRFVTRLVFTPGPGEWAVAPLPRALFPLYRIVRVSRLAARMVGGRI